MNGLKSKFRGIIGGIFISMLFQCSETPESLITTDVSDTLPDEKYTLHGDYRTAYQSELDTIFQNGFPKEKLVFFDLYLPQDSIPSDLNESLVLSDSLKKKGFRIQSSERGNWLEGPRMISQALSNDSCECSVDKFYKTTDQKTRYEIVERISCVPVLAH